MKNTNEIGGFKSFGKEANKAYHTYASVYLDIVDDNEGHFFGRDHDTAPIDELETLSDENVKKAYLDAAADIIKITISCGYFETLEEIYDLYPMMEERERELKAALLARDQVA